MVGSHAEGGFYGSGLVCPVRLHSRWHLSGLVSESRATKRSGRNGGRGCGWRDDWLRDQRQRLVLAGSGSTASIPPLEDAVPAEASVVDRKRATDRPVALSRSSVLDTLSTAPTACQCSPTCPAASGSSRAAPCAAPDDPPCAEADAPGSWRSCPTVPARAWW